jgi:hypothetical protein
LAAPNGLVANLFGPVESKRHDSAMLAQPDLYNKLQQLDPLPNEHPVCIYGDPAYPYRPQLQCPFKGARITPEQYYFAVAFFLQLQFVSTSIPLS